MSVNKVILIGNVGQEPQIRTVGDQKVATFNLATTERFKGKDGNMVESTEWHNVTIWGKLAEVVEKYVSKGTQLYVEGKIKTEKYTKDGQDRFITRIVASSLQLLGGKKEESAPAQQRPQYQTTPLIDGVVEPEDDDMPF